MNTKALTLGVDIGSTTIKFVIRRGGETLFESYDRHYSRVREKALELVNSLSEIVGGEELLVAVSGSAGLGLAEAAGLPFVQEVFATAEIVKEKEPDANCVIELGGEDAKIIFFRGGLDERMNGSCAGGTGAFLDQMAALLNLSVPEMDALSLKSERIYTIASRCGVFAKSDIQPLVNQGARKEDIASSIYQAVVNQTVAGLAQGRKIEGKVLFLGGPLHFCKGLRKRFQETLKLSDENAVFPDYGRFAVALGAALYAEKAGRALTLEALRERLRTAEARRSIQPLKPLFENEAEYAAFRARHERATAERGDIRACWGNSYLGIDCGSTTTKLILLDESGRILYSYYAANRGNPVSIVLEQLKTIRSLLPDGARIAGSAVTGYGEELIQNAFGVDLGVVETLAHFEAAKHFCPEVDFILDIGGQDIKCFSIKNGAIDSIMLNEACSSGCGSFLASFAQSLGCTVEEFAQKGLFARAPVNLGSRCTVFMNSSVKQAQKEGAGVEDISAGLSVSVVKNALYKVIRVSSAKDLGKHLLVQGGTFLNDAVLRAFEQETGREVTRPAIAGLMGAYGAALYAGRAQSCALLSARELEEFSYESRAAVCGGCENRCHLTVNSFSGGRKFVAGNRCDRALGAKGEKAPFPSLYDYKRARLTAPVEKPVPSRGRIGLPLSLGMYETWPLFSRIFSRLGFEVVSSGLSTRATYEKGQFTIPSDTACYPAKLMHGHIMALIEKGVDAIFAPCVTYNIDEKDSQNHYNCPVVAYYPELLKGNVDALRDSVFLYPYLDLNNEGQMARAIRQCLLPHFPGIRKGAVRSAVKEGVAAYRESLSALRKEGERALSYAREHEKRVLILAGRPYHADPEICHGIDRLAQSLGFVVVSEDSVCHLSQPPQVRVLNQWSYHARLYRAARFAAENEGVELVQLVSFGCGVDAITTDEVRAILEGAGKIYTQIKIDEITNLGAVRIRLRSLKGALEEKHVRAYGVLHTLHEGDERDAYHTHAEHAAAALSATCAGTVRRGL